MLGWFKNFMESHRGEDRDLVLAQYQKKLEEHADELSIKVNDLAKDNERLRRINLEYFEAITRFERQRDEWKSMFFTQAAEHESAQTQLVSALTDTRMALAECMRLVNEYRDKNGEPRLMGEVNVAAPPINRAIAYAQHMAELRKAASPLLTVEDEIAAAEGRASRL